jgi:hypothetical protein
MDRSSSSDDASDYPARYGMHAYYAIPSGDAAMRKAQWVAAVEEFNQHSPYLYSEPGSAAGPDPVRRPAAPLSHDAIGRRAFFMGPPPCPLKWYLEFSADLYQPYVYRPPTYYEKLYEEADLMIGDDDDDDDVDAQDELTLLAWKKDKKEKKKQLAWKKKQKKEKEQQPAGNTFATVFCFFCCCFRGCSLLPFFYPLLSLAVSSAFIYFLYVCRTVSGS